MYDKADNHKNPFTKEYKQAIQRKSTKTFKCMKRLTALLLKKYMLRNKVLSLFY